MAGAEPLTDLYLDVDPERDHTRGPEDAPVTIVEYGDFECPFCGQAEPVIRELLASSGDLQSSPFRYSTREPWDSRQHGTGTRSR